MNRILTVEKIASVIDQGVNEIILIVPYIKLSDNFYNRLRNADCRGVEITIIYRENKLQGLERQKLVGLANLNLFYHPEIHAKCYFNEKEMVITSMNLYEYSENYNREMGVLLSNTSSGDSFEYREALTEVRDIIKTASLEKKSARSESQGFTSHLLKPEFEKLFAPCKVVNRYFDNKKFEVLDNNYKGVIKCTNYFENLHVFFEPDFEAPINSETGEFKINRIAIDFSWTEEKRRAVNKAFWSPVTELMFPGFKVYWDYYSKDLTIYRDKWKFPKWNNYNQEDTILKFKEGIESVGTFVRKLEKELR